MSYKRILTVQDISCIGQCSMTVALPILSACGHEVCILPSAVLSTHTGGFGKPSITKLTDSMESIWHHWQQQGISFDAIYTGYLGSVDAVRIVSQIIDELLAPDGLLIVDPAMADHGKLYSGLDTAYAATMAELCLHADVMLPNVTEAAMMTGMLYRDSFNDAYIQNLLQSLGGKAVVLTGAVNTDGKTGAAIRNGCRIDLYSHERVDGNFHGTGDIFAAAFTGAYLQGKTMSEAMRIASDFTCKCLKNTVAAPAHWYGVKFEPVLSDLIEMLK